MQISESHSFQIGTNVREELRKSSKIEVISTHASRALVQHWFLIAIAFSNLASWALATFGQAGPGRMFTIASSLKHWLNKTYCCVKWHAWLRKCQMLSSVKTNCYVTTSQQMLSSISMSVHQLCFLEGFGRSWSHCERAWACNQHWCTNLFLASYWTSPFVQDLPSLTPKPWLWISSAP